MERIFKAMSAGFLFEPVPFEEAAKIIRDRPAVERDVFEKMIPEIRARAFLISGIEDLKVAQEIRDLVTELPRGGDWDALKKQVADKLMGKGGIPWLDEEAALKRANLLLAHHGFQAYAAMNYLAMYEKRDFFPYWKYITAGDERVRDSHAALHGLILPADDPFWLDHFPPWDWGCRCQVIPVGAGEYRDMVEAGRVAGKMVLPPEEKTKGWTLGKEGRNLLHTSAKLDDGSGYTIGVETPVQRAMKITEEGGASAARSAYRWHPGDVGVRLSELVDRYDEPVWNRFVEDMQGLFFEERDGSGRSVWDWALRPDRKAAADVVLELARKTGHEYLAVLDHRTGKTLKTITDGSNVSVSPRDAFADALMDGRRVFTVHTHDSVGIPSPGDLAVSFRFKEALADSGVAMPNRKIHVLRIPDGITLRRRIEMAKELDKIQEYMDKGIVSDAEWMRRFNEMKRKGELRHEIQ